MGNFLWSVYVVNMAKWQITWSSVILCLWILFSPGAAEDGGWQTEVTSLWTASARLGHCCSQPSVEWGFLSRANASGRSLGFKASAWKMCISWPWKYLHICKTLGSYDFPNFLMESGGKLRNWVWCWECKPSAKLLDTHVFSPGDASM